MPKTIRLTIPDSLYRSLNGLAKERGLALSDYLLAELKSLVGRPTLSEFRERLSGRTPGALKLDAAGLLGQERRSRDKRQ